MNLILGAICKNAGFIVGYILGFFAPLGLPRGSPGLFRNVPELPGV
jgi:hypothetical protein